MTAHIDPRTVAYHTAHALRARELFVAGLTPPAYAGDWRAAMEEAGATVAACLNATANLRTVERGVELSAGHISPLRHMLAPPASQDRFALICPDYPKAAENKGSPVSGGKAAAVAATFGAWRDRSLTGWLDAGRRATSADLGLLLRAVSPLMASQRVNTIQRNRLSAAQEQHVVTLLTRKGWTQLPSVNVSTLTVLPAKTFMRKTRFATRQRPQEVDIACGLGKTVVCAMECKVTNDETNSIKRVNDVLKKAKAWQDHWGSFVRTAALLQGVVRYRDVERLLGSDVRVFWSHDLARFGEWIDNPI